MTPEYFAKLREIESSNDPLKRNPVSTAKGLYQFIDKTGKEYGLDKYEFGTPEYTQAEEKAVREFTKKNKDYLVKSLKREPTAGELYLAHQQGAKGASRLLNNANKRASTLVGEKQVKNNKGAANMTGGDFANLWTSKFSDIPSVSQDTYTEQSQMNGNFALEGDISDDELMQLANEYGITSEQNTPEISDDELMQLSQEYGIGQPMYGGGKISDLRAGLAGAGDTATFGFADEIKGGLQGLVRGAIDPNLTIGEATDYFTNKARQDASTLQQENPYAYAVGQVGGAFLPASGGVALASKVPKVLQGGGRLVKTGKAVGAGAVSGGLYGLGSGQGGAQNRIDEGQTMALYGGVTGPAGAVLAPVGRRLAGRARALKDAVLKRNKANPLMSGRELAEQVTAPSKLYEGSNAIMSKVQKSLKKDFGDDYESVINALANEDISISDLYGAKTTKLATGAAQYGKGRKIAQDYFEREVSEAPERAMKSIADNVTGVDSYYATIDDILEAGRKKASPLYDEAYSGTIKDNNILQMPEIQDALNRAYKKYPSKLKDADPDSIKALDYAKRVIDADIEGATRGASPDKALVRDRTGIKNQLLDVMDASSPAYAKARKEAGDYLSLTGAMDEGLKYQRMDSELLSKVFKELPEAEKTAFRIGVGKSVRDAILKKNEGSNFYNAVMGSPEKKNKLATILSPKQYKRLSSDLKAEDRLFKLRNDIVGGSPTSKNQIAREEIQMMGADLAEAAATGGVVTGVTKGVSSKIRKMFDGINEETAAMVNTILFEKDPSKKLAIIQGLKGSKNLPKEQADLAKEIYMKNFYKIDPYRLRGSIAGGVIGGIISKDME